MVRNAGYFPIADSIPIAGITLIYPAWDCPRGTGFWA
jgi:hypothetical protein